MTRQKMYEKPQIETVRAAQIVETLGPVSCGSAGPLSVQPAPWLIDRQ